MTYSIRQMAAALGVSKSQVAREAKAGMPMQNLDAARAWRLANPDLTRAAEGRIDRTPTPTSRPSPLDVPSNPDPDTDPDDDPLPATTTDKDIRLLPGRLYRVACGLLPALEPLCVHALLLARLLAQKLGFQIHHLALDRHAVLAGQLGALQHVAPVRQLLRLAVVAQGVLLCGQQLGAIQHLLVVAHVGELRAHQVGLCAALLAGLRGRGVAARAALALGRAHAAVATPDRANALPSALRAVGDALHGLGPGRGDDSRDGLDLRRRTPEVMR